MTGGLLTQLRELMGEKLGSIEPANFPDEQFDLYSIPAFDRRRPEVAAGSSIGSAKQFVQPNDVLLSKIVPHIRRAWVVGPNSGRRMIASGEWIVFRGMGAVPGYLKHVLVSDPFHAQYMQTTAGVGGSLLRARPAQVASICIPLPEPSQQRRIAAILDKADALRAKRREALAQLDRLTQAIFVQMFGASEPKEQRWTKVQLGEIADVQGGLQLSGNRSSLPVQIPYLRVANVHRNRLDLAEIKLFNATAAEIERTKLVRGDLLVVEGHGNAEEIGRCAMWDGSINPCSHQNHLIRVRVDEGRADAIFVSHWLNSPAGRGNLIGASNTTSGLNTISVSKVRSSPVLMPPLSLQRQFSARIGRVHDVKRSCEQALQHTHMLFASLQHRAFRGEL